MNSVAGVDWVAVIVASVAAFVLGALWYRPFFSAPWMLEMGVDRSFKPRISRGLLFAVTMLFIFLSATTLDFSSGPGRVSFMHCKRALQLASFGSAPR